MHEGHRGRLLEQVMKSERLYPHQLMEALLFYSVHRKDTNGTAHLLVDKFGGVRQAVDADIADLVNVSGVGINTALFLKVISLAVKRTVNRVGFARLKNTVEFRAFVAARPHGGFNAIEISMLDKEGNVGRIVEYRADGDNGVVIDEKRLFNDVVAYRPYGMFEASYRKGEGVEPERSDDENLRSILKVCSVCGAWVYDFVIADANGCDYSYFSHDRLGSFRKTANGK